MLSALRSRRAWPVALVAAALTVMWATPAGAAFQDSSGSELSVLEAVILGLVEALIDFQDIAFVVTDLVAGAIHADDDLAHSEISLGSNTWDQQIRRPG